MIRRPLLVAALLLALAGCAESTAEVSAIEPEPDPRLIPAAERVLANAPTPEAGWRVGVVVAEERGEE